MGNRENWIYLINRLLQQADALTLRRAYYLLLGFMGQEKTVSGSGTHSNT